MVFSFNNWCQLNIQTRFKFIWDKVFKNGPSKVCGRQPLKNLKKYHVLKLTIIIEIFKGCLPQILLCPFLNTLSHMIFQWTSGAEDLTQIINELIHVTKNSSSFSINLLFASQPNLVNESSVHYLLHSNCYRQIIFAKFWHNSSFTNLLTKETCGIVSKHILTSLEEL